MRTIAILVAALVLTACQTAPDQNSSTAAAPTDAVNYAAEVAALSDRQRNAVFLRAIRDAGHGCQGVTRSEQVGDRAGKATWRAKCDDGTAHLVQVRPDGTAMVTSRTAP